MAYLKIPGIDEQNKFPPPVRQGIADSAEVVSKMTSVAQSVLVDNPTGEEAIRYCKLSLNANVTIANNATATINWDKELEDPYNMHNNTNPSRITCNLSGLYIIVFSVNFMNNSGAERSVIVRKNEVPVFDRMGVPPGSQDVTQAHVDFVRMSVGDYLTCSIWSSIANTQLRAKLAASDTPTTYISFARIGA